MELRAIKIHVILVTFLSVVLTTFGQNGQEEILDGKNPFDLIITQYHSDVVGITNEGHFRGSEAMKEYLSKLFGEDDALTTYQTHYTIPVRQVLEYEIGSSQTKEGNNFAHLIIWSNGNSKKQRIAEVIFERSAEMVVPAELADARATWMKLCNTHKSKQLVKELYTENALYFNRGRILKGHGQLSNEYSYMDSPSYQLQLNPNHIERISEDVIYEIGRCSGSYPLPYILVWHKQPDGSWKIYFDSNY